LTQKYKKALLLTHHLTGTSRTAYLSERLFSWLSSLTDGIQWLCTTADLHTVLSYYTVEQVCLNNFGNRKPDITFGQFKKLLKTFMFG